VIDKAGRVASVELLRGVDDRLNRSAEEALSKWEFYPATRNGVPLDVDVVVEIPFKLEPVIHRR
jgi:TonB family protein